MPNSVRISKEKPKLLRRGWRGRGSQTELPSSFKKKKSSLPKGEKVPVGCCLGSALARRVNSAVVSSAFASSRVWVRALPPPLRLWLFRDSESLRGSSYSRNPLAGNPQVCLKCWLLRKSPRAPDSDLSPTLQRRRRYPKLHSCREPGRRAQAGKGGGRKDQPAAALTEAGLRFVGAD